MGMSGAAEMREMLVSTLAFIPFRNIFLYGNRNELTCQFFFRICFLCSSFKLDKGVVAADYSFLCIVRRPCLSSFAAVCRSQAGQNKGTSVLLEQVYPDGSACPSRLRLFNILTHEYFKGPECTIEGCWHDMEET